MELLVTSAEIHEEELKAYGFNESVRSVHSSRTMMLSELELVMQNVNSEITPDSVREAILEQNILGKATQSGRRNTATKLISLYAFDATEPLFRSFALLWSQSDYSRPALGLLLAMSRDKILRTTGMPICQAEVGSHVTKESLYKCLASSFSSKYAETTLQSTTRNVLSSWRQSGHIQGESPITRVKCHSDYLAFSFAAYIAYLRGLRGQNLLNSFWIRVLDFEPAELSNAITESHRRGLITTRKVGSIVEITPGPSLEEVVSL